MLKCEEIQKNKKRTKKEERRKKIQLGSRSFGILWPFLGPGALVRSVQPSIFQRLVDYSIRFIPNWGLIVVFLFVLYLIVVFLFVFY